MCHHTTIVAHCCICWHCLTLMRRSRVPTLPTTDGQMPEDAQIADDDSFQTFYTETGALFTVLSFPAQQTWPDE